ncbi:hypothetical protein BC937DRAFT_88982 [Endogone sp. FLAS-F59071]|nr:hypothetical protein BC937DRAFT_88982 [Endogone sp. FLAS-F59071]|eukprot:RUS18259.1 hypothetical protein BC937DRAFT_88982 [Endogone sp. FLAS-F59071]
MSLGLSTWTRTMLLGFRVQSRQMTHKSPLLCFL